MYESQFGFSSRPFTAAPSADRFFPTETTRKAFESVVSCIERASGAAVIVGGSGIGKSVFLQAIGRHFQQDFSVAILESASLNSRRELLQSILFELGLPYRGMEEGELRLTLMDYLKPSDRCPNGLLLCVDEAHLLATNLLEEMRMITNLVRDGQPRARLVLAGNASIEERLADPKLESLCQRISTRVHLERMNAIECRQYIDQNLVSVEKKAADLFDEDAMEAVYIATNGVPRLVNQVCDHVLVQASTGGQTRISKEMINEAWSDIQRLPVEWHVLGTETESKEENVIEFGTLDDPPVASGRGDDSVAMEEKTELNPATEDPPEQEPQTGNHNVKEDAQSSEFVVEGSEKRFSNPFPEEKPNDDSFSQVIGHSPQEPDFPESNSLLSTQNTVNTNVTSENEMPEHQASESRVQEQIEDRISQTVSDLTKEVNLSTDQADANQDQAKPEGTISANDDRDMIIVEEKPSSGPVDTVPIREVEVGETSTQAKRENYQQLFDRLRNG